MRGSTASRSPLVVIFALFFLIESPIGAVRARSGTPSPGGEKPFDTMTIAVHVAGVSASGSFADLWNPSPALRVDIAAPVYAGIAQAGVDVFDHRARDASVPDFGCVYAWLGWAYRWELPRGLTCAAGVEAGVSYMMFDDESTARAREEETELGFGVTSQMSYALTDRWSAVLSGSYRKVRTSHPIEYVSVGVGLGRTFSTPRWLKEFLE